MIIEPDGNGGWFVDGVDSLNASIHLTESWLVEYEEHQGPQHGLRHLLATGSTDADRVRDGLRNALTGRRPGRQRMVRSQQLRDWKKEKRANRR